MDRMVLITGASRGLGLCLTRKYLEDGDTVFAGARNVTAETLIKLQREYPERLIPVIIEVTDTDILRQSAEEVKKHTEHLDIVINNAAIHNDTSFEVLEEADIDDCLKVYDVNSLGPLRVVKAFLPLIQRNRAAKIINISSESGSIGTCGREKEFDYCMSKAALNMGTRLLSNYLKKDNIIVLAVHPGWMRTDMGGSNAELDPYETACRLVKLFDGINNTGNPVFIDSSGNPYQW